MRKFLMTPQEFTFARVRDMGGNRIWQPWFDLRQYVADADENHRRDFSVINKAL
jgi:hypothetical protein